MNNTSVLAPSSATTLLTPQQENNFASFWRSRGWSEEKIVSKVVLHTPDFENRVTDLYDTLKPSATLPQCTVNAVLETIEKAHSMDGEWEWQGTRWNRSSRDDKGYGLAGIRTAEGKDTSLSATRLFYKLLTGVTVKHHRIEQLDHINHSPVFCEMFTPPCICTRSVNPLQLALVAPAENILRSSGQGGCYYSPKPVPTRCKYGHPKRGKANCPTCKAEYDAARYKIRTDMKMSAQRFNAIFGR